MDCFNLPGDFTEEFLTVRGKTVNNPELAKGLNSQEVTQKSDRMTFGATNPLPWELQMTPQDQLALNNANAKTCVCPDCGESHVRYDIVSFVHSVKFNNTGNAEIDKTREEIDRRKFGKREIRFTHIRMLCGKCKRFIKFVPYTKTNRRAAKDPLINGPHQQKRRG